MPPQQWGGFLMTEILSKRWRAKIEVVHRFDFEIEADSEAAATAMAIDMTDSEPFIHARVVDISVELIP